mgnify:FL=1
MLLLVVIDVVISYSDHPNLDTVADVFALKDVVLTIRPQIVERSGYATLMCSYDLEGASLYYVKWYRGKYEFYRYTPSEKTKTKLFPLGGINVNVSNSMNNSEHSVDTYMRRRRILG